jgi:hypothetical protein
MIIEDVNAFCLLARYQNRFHDDKILPLNEIIDNITILWSSIIIPGLKLTGVYDCWQLGRD